MPISLCNVILKIISKVLVNRICPFQDLVIGPLQSSFIPGKGTTDNALIAQEVVHQMHKKQGKIGYLLFKIDFKKAYDKVDWNFLRKTMEEFGFPERTTTLVLNCTTTTNLSQKWNNEILKSFTP